MAKRTADLRQAMQSKADPAGDRREAAAPRRQTERTRGGQGAILPSGS